MTNKFVFLLIVFLFIKPATSQVDTLYWSTGEVQLVVSRENGNLSSTSYYKNGQINEQHTLNNGVKIGEWWKYYPSGKTESTTTYIKGDLECSYISFYESSQVKSKGCVKNGIDYEYQYYYETGILQTSLETLDTGERLHKEFYPSGSLKRIGTYAPFRNGTWQTYYESGELKRTEEFRNNQMIGVWKEYYKNQKLKQKEECVTNTMYRDVKEYHPNGTLKAIGRSNYAYSEDGQKMGEWKEYYDNGALYKSYQFDNGLKIGYWRTYYKNGTVLEQGLYEKGKPIGFWEEFHSNGQLKNVGEYSKNIYRMEKSGLWKMYHKNGILKRTTQHFYRGISGEAREYYRNGNLMRIEHWGCDAPYGTWEYFRRNGKLRYTKDHGKAGEC